MESDRITKHMSVESQEQYVALFGLRDENIDLIRRELGVEIFAHGSDISVTGSDEKVDLALLTMEKLMEIIAKG